MADHLTPEGAEMAMHTNQKAKTQPLVQSGGEFHIPKQAPDNTSANTQPPRMGRRSA